MNIPISTYLAQDVLGGYEILSLMAELTMPDIDQARGQKGPSH